MVTEGRERRVLLGRDSSRHCLTTVFLLWGCPSRLEQNLISRIQNLDCLLNVKFLSLSGNKITTVQWLDVCLVSAWG